MKAHKVLKSHTKEAGNYLGTTEYMLLDKGTKQSIKAIEANIEKVDKDIESILRGDENLKRLSDLVTSVDSVGMVTCAAMLVKTNKFQDYTEAMKFACTAGLAPFEHSSGKSVRGKTRDSHRTHKDLKHFCICAHLKPYTEKENCKISAIEKWGRGKTKCQLSMLLGQIGSYSSYLQDKLRIIYHTFMIGF